MRYAISAAAAALMLAVVLTVGLALTLALLASMVVAANASGAWSLIVGLALGAALALWARAALVRRRKDPGGVSLTTDEQPLIWAEIYSVAERLGVRPPAQLRLFPDASVAVSQAGSWLGLRRGIRCVHLGLPVLDALSECELRALLAHEFARAWGTFSLARLIYAGQQVIGWVAARVTDDSRVGRSARRFGRAYLAVALPVTTRLEQRANRASAQIAGKSAAVAALCELAVLTRGWEEFVDGYTSPAAAVGARPEDLFGGFAAFLAAPGRREQLAAALGQEPHLSPAYDRGLSLTARLRVVTSLPADHVANTSGPALSLVRGSSAVAALVADAMFAGAGLVPAAWEDIMPEADAAAARAAAAALVRLAAVGGLPAPLSPPTLLDVLAAGLAADLVAPLVATSATPAGQRRVAAALVTGFLASAAIEVGTASYQFSWCPSARLVDEDGKVDHLGALVDRALADPGKVYLLQLWCRSHRVGPPAPSTPDVYLPVPAQVEHRP